MADTFDLDFGWRATLYDEQGWRVVRLHPGPTPLGDVPGLVGALWDRLGLPPGEHLLVEMDDVEFVGSSLMGELVRLHKRIATTGGVLHLAGLRPDCRMAMHTCRLDTVLPCYDSRAEALAAR